MKKIYVLLLSAPLIFLTGCTKNISSQSYEVGSVGHTSKVVPATVVSARPVEVSGTKEIGTPIGAIAGGVAGSAIGGGTRANILGAIGGVVIGGIAGSAIESGITKQTGIEYVVELKNGGLLTLVQGSETVLSVGQRVLLIYGPPTRLIPDTREQ